LKYRITYQNTGNTQAMNVIVRDNLPPKMTLVPNTTRVYSSLSNGNLDTSNNITGGGINVGNPMPGAVVYVVFEVQVPTANQLACGETTFRNIGIAHPQVENEYYNVAVTTMNKTCANTPTYSCDQFHVTPGDNRTVTVDTFKTSQSNGATFKNVVINWGDQSQALTTNNAVGQKHTYGANGTYTLTATAHFDVNGQDVATTGSCTQVVPFTPGTPPTTPPTQLVNTGAGDVVGIAAVVAVVSAFAYNLLGRRLSRQ
ncbi:MAG: hypothetical protein ACREGB_00395, partial [Candidatus Saccharimonadales bacterium]